MPWESAIHLLPNSCLWRLPHSASDLCENCYVKCYLYNCSTSVMHCRWIYVLFYVTFTVFPLYLFCSNFFDWLIDWFLDWRQKHTPKDNMLKWWHLFPWSLVSTQRHRNKNTDTDGSSNTVSCLVFVLCPFLLDLVSDLVLCSSKWFAAVILYIVVNWSWLKGYFYTLGLILVGIFFLLLLSRL